MANAIYPLAKQEMLQGNINMSARNIHVALVDSQEYTYSAAHQFLSTISASARVKVSPALAGKTFTNGVFDANDVTVSAVTGDQFEFLIIYASAAGVSASPLIAFLDTDVSGLPLTPNGGNVTITWDSGANKIFAL